jgi:hypothetical protein
VPPRSIQNSQLPDMLTNLPSIPTRFCATLGSND